MQSSPQVAIARGPSKWIRGYFEPALPSTPHNSAAVLTLLLLILFLDSSWYIGVPIAALASAAWILPNLRDARWFWFVVSCFLIFGAAINWATTDNHRYLLGYWSLALFCAALLPHDQRDYALATSARLLVGLSFLFATCWKLLSPDFLSGDFFQYTLLFDARFVERAKVLGFLDSSVAELNHSAQQALMAHTSGLNSVEVISTAGLRSLAVAMTWWGLVCEAAVALCFLAPNRAKIGRYRNEALLGFVLTTYLIAPVVGFGSLLLTMGYVQCEPDRRKTRVAYLTTFAGLQLYRAPWPLLL